MPSMFLRFTQDEDGAVTIDWVVLTAAIVALNLIVMFTPIREALTDVAAQIASTIRSAGDQLPAGDG